MIETFKSPQILPQKNQYTVFLAGPMRGAPRWQTQAPKVAAKVGVEDVTFLNPHRAEGLRYPIAHTLQVNWETLGLRMCDVILFWIPPQAKEIKSDHIYAITTRMELAENLVRGHKIILGVDPECKDLSGIKYLIDDKARYYGLDRTKIHSTLEDCMKELKEWIDHSRAEEPKVHHMQGPAFGPFEPLGHVMNPETVRNEDLMEHWNQTVAPGDTVYVGGDFGSEEWKPFLNGTIIQK